MKECSQISRHIGFAHLDLEIGDGFSRGLDAQPSAKSARGRTADKRDELAPLHVTAQWLETNTLRSVGEREMVRGRRKMVLRPMSLPGPKTVML